jgi:hypothetical protein
LRNKTIEIVICAFGANFDPQKVKQYLITNFFLILTNHYNQGPKSSKQDWRPVTILANQMLEI